VVFCLQISPPKFCRHLSSSPTCRMPRPSHPRRFDDPCHTCSVAEVTSSLLCSFLQARIPQSWAKTLAPAPYSRTPSSYTDIPVFCAVALSSNKFLSVYCQFYGRRIISTFSQCSSLNVGDQVPHPCKASTKLWFSVF